MGFAHLPEPRDPALSRLEPEFESPWGRHPPHPFRSPSGPWASDARCARVETMGFAHLPEPRDHGPFKAGTGVRISVGSLSPLPLRSPSGPWASDARCARVETMGFAHLPEPRDPALSRLEPEFESPWGV